MSNAARIAAALEHLASSVDELVDAAQTNTLLAERARSDDRRQFERIHRETLAHATEQLESFEREED
jgi:hypothetical protein